MTLQEAMKLKAGGNKYKNEKITTPDGKFDSKREYTRWCELKILYQAGEIINLKRQVKYVLIPTQRDESGKLLEKETSYIADFDYDRVFPDPTDKTGIGIEHIVEDAKGVRTEGYRIKKKLMLSVHGIIVREV